MIRLKVIYTDGTLGKIRSSTLAGYSGPQFPDNSLRW